MKKVKILWISYIAFLYLLVSTVAVNGDYQNINVQTTPVNGAHCSLKNWWGEWVVNSTPGQVTIVHRSRGALIVNCVKAGYKPAQKIVNSHANKIILNLKMIFSGNSIGDYIAYSYPNNIQVNMVR